MHIASFSEHSRYQSKITGNPFTTRGTLHLYRDQGHSIFTWIFLQIKMHSLQKVTQFVLLSPWSVGQIESGLDTKMYHPVTHQPNSPGSFDLKLEDIFVSIKVPGWKGQLETSLQVMRRDMEYNGKFLWYSLHNINGCWWHLLGQGA